MTLNLTLSQCAIHAGTDSTYCNLHLTKCPFIFWELTPAIFCEAIRVRCACVTSGSIKILDTPLQTDYKERNFWSLNQWNNRCRDKRRCLALCVHKTTKIVFLSEVSGFSLGISSHGIWLPQLRPRPPWHSLCFSDLRRTKFFHEKITFFEKEKRSIGTGNMMVLFFSAEMLLRVWR